MEEKTISQRIHELKQVSKTFAKAHSEMVYLTHFRKSKVAILKKQYALENPKWSNAKCDDYARSHQDYLDLLDALREATETRERTYYDVNISNRAIDLYRTMRADRRTELENLHGE